jgi:pimeloyl-ACP methyl ester carboxylesterase
MKENKNRECFDFNSVRSTLQMQLKKPEFIKSFDGTNLAYYSFVPGQAKAAIIFYHGGGIWSASIYQHMAQQLAERYSIATYLFDIRGHGNSQGKRGDAPSSESVWKDIDVAIKEMKLRYPDLPIFLAGHSSGAGLILNYGNWKKNPDIQGYLLLSPYLGDDSKTVREDQRLVTKVRSWIFMLQGLTGLNLFNNTAAVFFNYPEWLKKLDPHVLSYYTTAMAKATAPYHAKEIFAQLNRPFALFVGDQDEQFYPDKVIAFKEDATKVKGKSIAEIVPHETHLSIILKAPELFNEAIETLSK